MKTQHKFHFPLKSANSALHSGEIVVDLFAGGGGASEALEQALGRPVDIAINHDDWAIGMHSAHLKNEAGEAIMTLSLTEGGREA